MAGSLLIPVHVSAKVVNTQKQVPDLEGAPFNRDATLQPGVHLHWALPDALTRAGLNAEESPNAALFPGVPDLWLVIRFNQAPQESAPNLKRTWRAWVVDSRSETATQLGAWASPTNRDPDFIHTAAGVLPSAASVDRPGWGLWDSSLGTFDPLVTAYYPACRRRLGFHDPLDDIPKTGKISYTVIGWYSLLEHDPLYMADNRQELLERWAVAHDDAPESYCEIPVGTRLPGTVAAASWKPTTIQMSQSSPAPAKVQDATRAGLQAGTPSARVTQLRTMEEAVPTGPNMPEGSIRMVVEGLASLTGPREIRCHGSVVEVPLGGSGTLPAAIGTDNVRLYPTIKRAMAEIASAEPGENVEFVEMVLQDLDSQKGTVAGLIDYPGAAHAGTFQGVPGKSHFYARIDVHAKPQGSPYAGHFEVTSAQSNVSRPGSGHWPSMLQRSASAAQDPDVSNIPPPMLYEPPPAPPQGAPQEAITAWITAWIEAVRAAFDAAASDAWERGTPIDERLIYVYDRRSEAQPANLGQLSQGRGSDSAGYWLDIDDDLALEGFLRATGGALVHLPDVNNLYEVPGPRWYRPWAPQIALFDTDRSYRFGYDGRFRADGFVRTRMSGETLTGLTVGSIPTVQAADLLANPRSLFSVAGLPTEARALANESLLLDTENAGVMTSAVASDQPPAEQQRVQESFRAAVRGVWLSRVSDLPPVSVDALENMLPLGIEPSAVAVTPWKDPRDPLFLDVNYSHPYSSVASDWKLEPDHVDLTAVSEDATLPPAGQVKVFEERTPVTASVAKVLDSALVTKTTLDAQGLPVRAQSPPDGIEEDTFKKVDVVSAPLTGFDASVFADGLRERSGALRLNKLDLIDVFGLSRPGNSAADDADWSSGIDPQSTEGGPNLKFWTEMTPRLPYWARLLFSLQSAEAPNEEASPFASPILGILLPDFVEHALEVFDGDGRAIGQISADRPQFGSSETGEPVTLAVRFDVHPWVAAELGLAPDDDPLDAIVNNPVLRSFVASVVAQTTDVPPGYSDWPDPTDTSNWFETGLTAMLRVIDTIRGTLDPSVTTQDRKVRLLGEPIVLMAARVSLEGTETTNPTELKQDPAPLAAQPPLPTVPVRIGDVARPDDGVLGLFVPPPPGEPPAAGRFAPASEEAAKMAVLNGLSEGVASEFPEGLAVSHPFVHDQASEFEIQPNEQPRDVYILADPRGGLYATCGVLPRKKITIPKEALDAALRNLEPTFPVGPVMTIRRAGAVRPIVPPPRIEGLVGQFVHAEPATNGTGETFSETPVPPVPPVAELPEDRVVLDEGWMRVFKPPQT